MRVRNSAVSASRTARLVVDQVVAGRVCRWFAEVFYDRLLRRFTTVWRSKSVISRFDAMGARLSSHLPDEEISALQEETGFTRSQIIRLHNRYLALAKSDNDRGEVTREDLLRIPEININPLGDRIVDAFFPVHHERNMLTASIDFRQFVRTLACFRPVKVDTEENEINSRVAKLYFAFRMYDVNCDGFITQDELLSLLSMMVGSNITPEQLASIADRTILEADKDEDGKISFEEFRKIMAKVDIEQRMSIRFLS